MIIIFDDYIELCTAKTIVRNIRNLDLLDWLEYSANMIGISDKIYKKLKENRIKFKIHEKYFTKNDEKNKKI